jgi:hypothetical protein
MSDSGDRTDNLKTKNSILLAETERFKLSNAWRIPSFGRRSTVAGHIWIDFTPVQRIILP